MKNLFTVLFCFSACIPSFAQNGFLFQPQIGFGFSRMNGPERTAMPYNYDDVLSLKTQNACATFDAEIKVAYEYKRWRLYTGLQFIQTAAMQNPVYVETIGSYGTYYSAAQDAYTYYGHLIIPVSVGYRLPLYKQWEIVPEIGTQLLFVKEDNSALSNSNKFLLSGKLNVERKISKAISIVVSPSYYMLNAPVYFQAGRPYPPDMFSGSVKASNSVFMLQAGILYGIFRIKKVN